MSERTNMSPIVGHKMGSFCKQQLDKQQSQHRTLHDFKKETNKHFTTQTRRDHLASMSSFIPDSLKWLRWPPQLETTKTTNNLNLNESSNYFTAPMNLLVTKHLEKSRYSKISPSHRHLLQSALFYLPLLLVLLLDPNLVQESHGNPAPSGFFISGHAIPCTVGQPVDILDHIPFADPSLRKCYGCSCPEGSVVCDKLKDQSNCDYQRPAAPKAPVAPSKGGVVKHNAIGNRASPTTTLLTHHPASHHSHHHGHPVVSSPGAAAKAKRLGVPLKVKSIVATETNSAGPQSGAQQPQHKKSGVGSPRSLSSEPRGPISRNQHHYNRHHSSRHIVSAAQDEDEPYRLRETMRPPTPYPYVAEILQTPAMPVDDPRHHEHAAAVLNLPLAEYLRKRERHMKSSSSRQTPEPTTTTTPEPTTTTVPYVEEQTEETTNGGIDNEALDAEQLTTTTTTTFITTTTTESVPQVETTTTQTPGIISLSIGEEEDLTTELPNTDQPVQATIDDLNIADNNNNNLQGQQSTESPSSELIERDQSVVTFDNSGNQMKKPQLEAGNSSPPVTVEVNNHLDQNNHSNLMIDNQQANEIMEQVSHDGILYIAIGVEAIILMSIIAMMIIFYLFREKPPPDELPEYHQALQMPRRSPSLEKA